MKLYRIYKIFLEKSSLVHKILSFLSNTKLAICFISVHTALTQYHVTKVNFLAKFRLATYPTIYLALSVILYASVLIFEQIRRNNNFRQLLKRYVYNIILEYTFCVSPPLFLLHSINTIIFALFLAPERNKKNYTNTVPKKLCTNYIKNQTFV